MNNLIMGNPMSDSTQIGPLAKKEFVDDLRDIVNSSINEGAKCLMGGDSEGCFYNPVLLVDVTENMSVFKKETFGPVFCVSKIKDVDEAIYLANKSDYCFINCQFCPILNYSSKIISQVFGWIIAKYFINFLS